MVDSFEGCPAPDADAYPQDASDRHHTFTNLQASAVQFKGFSRFRHRNMHMIMMIMEATEYAYYNNNNMRVMIINY